MIKDRVIRVDGCNGMGWVMGIEARDEDGEAQMSWSKLETGSMLNGSLAGWMGSGRPGEIDGGELKDWAG